MQRRTQNCTHLQNERSAVVCTPPGSYQATQQLFRTVTSTSELIAKRQCRSLSCHYKCDYLLWLVLLANPFGDLLHTHFTRDVCATAIKPTTKPKRESTQHSWHDPSIAVSHLWCDGCAVVKLCTKFELNRAIRGGVIAVWTLTLWPWTHITCSTMLCDKV